MTVVFKKRGAQDGAGSPGQGASEASAPAAATTLQVPQSGSEATGQAGTTPSDAAPPPPPPTQAETQTAPAESVTPSQQDEQPQAEQQQGEQPAKQEKAAKPAKTEKAEKKSKPARDKGRGKEKEKDSSGSSGGSSSSWSVNRVRTLVARTVWLVFVVCAVVLALSAFMFALDFNAGNGLVDFLYGFADRVDLGVFDTDNPIRTFRTDGARDLTKITLLNYGIGAIVYLVAGRVLDRLIRP